MPRQAPRIRDAGPEDAWDLLYLWAAVSGVGDTLAHDRTRRDAEQALAIIALDPDQRLLVAEHEDGIVAAMKLSRGPLWPLALDQAVHSSFLLVLPRYRRHGYGHALMEAALAWAEEKDITQITAVTDGNRDTNRFFARLGLATLGNVRFASPRPCARSSRPSVAGSAATATWSRCWRSVGRCGAARALADPALRPLRLASQSSSTSTSSSGASYWIRCPASFTSRSVAPGIAACSRWARSTGIQVSSVPHTTCTGIVDLAEQRARPRR